MCSSFLELARVRRALDWKESGIIKSFCFQNAPRVMKSLTNSNCSREHYMKIDCRGVFSMKRMVMNEFNLLKIFFLRFFAGKLSTRGILESVQIKAKILYEHIQNLNSSVFPVHRFSKIEKLIIRK